MATKRQVESTSLLPATPSDAQEPYSPTALIFDSGVGGLSIYERIRQILPDLHIVYAFDNAFFPYGEQPEALIIERVVSIAQAVHERSPLDIIVVACNTASTVTLPALRTVFSIPIVGVVPAIKPAASKTKNGVIGVLATRATVKRSYTQDLITRFATECHVELLGSARLVEIAEEKLQGQPVNLAEVREILSPWLNLPTPPDVIVLGCTHFPLLRTELAQCLPDAVELVDSGEAVARRVFSLLAGKLGDIRHDQNRAYCTDSTNQVKALEPALLQYGFKSLQELSLTLKNG